MEGTTPAVFWISKITNIRLNKNRGKSSTGNVFLGFISNSMESIDQMNAGQFQIFSDTDKCVGYLYSSCLR